MSVSATVVESVRIETAHQATNLVITAYDIERGYVEVPAASRLAIKNKGSCLFEFRAVSHVFQSVSISSRDGTVEFSTEGGTILRKSLPEGSQTFEFGYRFRLAPGVTPGVYAWPLALTVLPM